MSLTGVRIGHTDGVMASVRDAPARQRFEITVGDQLARVLGE